MTDAGETGSPNISAAVAVCTKDRSSRVAELIANIASVRPTGVLVVVDASDDDATMQRCHELNVEHPGLQVRYVRAASPGLARQRNQAARICADLGAEVVHFLDDDARVFPGYFDAIERRFAGDPLLGGVGGRVENQRREAHPRFNQMFLLSGLYPYTILKSGRVVNPQQADGARRESGVRNVQWLQGFAMSYRTSVLRRLTFDERLTGYSYGEDRDFSFRVSREWKLTVEPEARCLHLRAPENRHDAGRLAFESTVLIGAWVREHRGDGFSFLAFLWSVLGDLLRHCAAAATAQPGVSGDPTAYVRGVLRGLVRMMTVHSVADAVAQTAEAGSS